MTARRRGRPPLDPHAKTIAVAIKASPSELAAWRAAAVADGCNLSEWIRRRCAVTVR
jgi:hypothetical protein